MSEEVNKDVEVIVTKGNGVARFSNEKTLRNAESVDSFHHDEAAKVLFDYKAAGGPEEWSPLEEKNLIRKIDRRLLPVLGFTFFLTWYDKGILAQAVSEEFHLSLLKCGSIFFYSQRGGSHQSRRADTTRDPRQSSV